MRSRRAGEREKTNDATVPRAANDEKTCIESSGARLEYHHPRVASRSLARRDIALQRHSVRPHHLSALVAPSVTARRRLRPFAARERAVNPPPPPRRLRDAYADAINHTTNTTEIAAERDPRRRVHPWRRFRIPRLDEKDAVPDREHQRARRRRRARPRHLRNGWRPSADVIARNACGVRSLTSADVKRAAAAAESDAASRVSRASESREDDRDDDDEGGPVSVSADVPNASSAARTSRGDSGNTSRATEDAGAAPGDAWLSSRPRRRPSRRLARLLASASGARGDIIPGLTTSTTVRTASPVTRPAMSLKASLLLAASAAAKKSSKVLLSAVLSR